MAVISVRLNQNEETIINYLSDLYSEDKSTLIKHSLYEMYEDSLDLEKVYSFESKIAKKTTSFISGEDILKVL